MGSILDVLPAEGALFTGRSGALRLPDGCALLVTRGSAQLVESPTEPPDNEPPAPAETTPSRRPSYMDAFPLFQPPSPSNDAPKDVFHALWPRRDEPDSYVRQDPYIGGLIRAAQALRLAAAAQADPIALSCRLTFGDPADPEAVYQLNKTVEGLADAARMFRLPVLARALRTDPSIGLQPAVVVSAHTAAAASFSSDGVAPLAPSAGDAIALLGRMTGDLSGSLYVGRSDTFAPPIDLVVEGRVQEIVRQTGSAVPLGRGGLLVTLARCCDRARVGARVTWPAAWSGIAPAALLFGEAQSRFLVFLPAERLPELQSLAEPLGVPLEHIGFAGGPELEVDGAINLNLEELELWSS